MTGVYFIKCQDFIKIGYATNIYQRLKNMQVGNPYDLSLVAVGRCNTKIEAMDAERFWQDVFGKYYYKGEWYYAKGIEDYLRKGSKKIEKKMRRHKWVYNIYERPYKFVPIEQI